MKVLITGANGMLGRTLMRRISGHELIGVDLDRCDLRSASDASDLLRAEKPEAVIHTAAFTDVDACESRADEAWSVNAYAAGNVAIAAHRAGARLIAISTDYVFSGDLDRPYHEWDTPQPRTVYGQSKWAGERMVRRHCPDHLIVRTAWLYGPGGPSFVHTMRRLGSQPGPPLKVVKDQVGNPTSTLALADHIQRLLETPIAGTMHLTCSQEASWYDLAVEIFAATGLQRPIEPCTSEQFPRPAPRPANSRLDNRALRMHDLPAMNDWKSALNEFLHEYPDG
jgi:dTDP-4-dehydrorhamnose reductase